jgi:aspartyl/asparaginyl-tRNA synthetase
MIYRKYSWQTRAAISGHFADAGYVHVDAPVLSGNECEGGGNVFYVVVSLRQ